MSGTPVAVHFTSGCTHKWPAVTHDTPQIRVVIDDVDSDVLSLAVATNLGAGLDSRSVLVAVGHALHQAAHALLFPDQTINLTDLITLPETTTGSST